MRGGTPKNARNNLAKYWQKRDFGQTPEPRGKLGPTGAKTLSYFIQRHHARRLHYDFRLELGGTLKSWAVPKGPSFDPADKRLAVHVEDHPLDYGTFEGDIPAHQYGAGHVVLWDKGVWVPLGDPEEGLRKGHLKFTLAGEKLSGQWVLVRMGPSRDEKENWLLIKEHDAEAKTGRAARITELRPESVLNKPDKRANYSAPAKAKAASKAKKVVAKKAGRRVPPTAIDFKNIEGARKAELPEFIKPQLATLTDSAPPGSDWLLEIKFDGYRALCRIDKGAARLYTRAANDWTTKWRDIATAAAEVPVKQAWLDGEVVAIDRDGNVSFQLLQNMDRHGTTERLAYYVFDLLYLDGYDLRAVALRQRKALLQTLLSGLGSEGPLLYSEHLAGDAAHIFTNACLQGLEGLIVKRADAGYESARSRSWLKVKCLKRQEFVIGGYTDPAGSRASFGALLVGVYDQRGALRYAGKVGTGFSDDMLESVAKQLKKHPARQSPFVDPPTGAEARGVHWLKPALVAEIKFAQWTDSGHIRHASFIGLRADKDPREIRREQAVPVNEVVTASGKPKASAPAAAATARRVKRSASAENEVIADVKLTHPDRILFPDIHATKRDLASYYADIADWILPHLAQRPLTLLRCPDGAGHACFYQKHANATTAKDLSRVEVPSGDGTTIYMTADNRQALMSLVQMGVLELHTWGSRKGRLDKPDRMIFDLDPAPDVEWQQVIEGAQLVRGLLDELGLASFVKTTGGKGLHVVVPLKPERKWDEVKAFSRAVAYHLAATLPDRYTAKMTKATRTGKIFVDYLRNGPEATAVAAYSTRARPGAPVSVPIAWEELSESLRSDTYKLDNIRERLSQLVQDPWRDYYALQQRISAKALRSFKFT